MSTSKPSSSIPDGVTKAQRAMLEVLAHSSHAMRAGELLTFLYEHHRTSQGVHQTAASLVRRGYLEKGNQSVRLTRSQPPRKSVAYRITHAGRQFLAALSYTERGRTDAPTA